MSTIDNLDIEIKSSASQASTGIDRLVDSLNRLKGVSPSKIGLGTLANQLNRLNTALSSMTNLSKLYSLTNSLKSLSSVEKLTGLQSATRQLSKLPQIASDLEKTDMDKFAKKINEVTDAIKPLATEMEKVSNGFSALPTKIQRIIQSNEKLANSNKKASKSYGILGTGISGFQARLGTTILKAKLIGNVIGDFIAKSNEYVENLNLFTVSLGEFADQEQQYAELVSDKLGIDPADWLRAQGIFNTLATGFGVANEKAVEMSRNLTQLSYDISSMYNIQVSDAMTKLQSAFSGELEPVRRLGYDLSQTKLQAIATANGIDILVSDMTQAEKSMLRYYALMTQVTEVQGDMARTLESPSNQLRIFKAQLNMTAREIGNIFIPALNAILPYAIAILKIIRLIAQEIANLFGYELPEFDYSKVNTGVEDLSKGFDDATKSAKKLKKATMGFDELNILNEDTDGGAGDVLGGVRFDLEMPDYNGFLEGIAESRADKIFESIKEHLDEILALVTLIGLGLIAWKITLLALNLASLGTTLAGALSVFLATLLTVLGVMTAIIGAGLLIYGVYDAWVNGLDWNNLLIIFAGILFLVAGLLIVGGKIGAVIGSIIGGIALIVLGAKDMIMNGINTQNITAIFVGLGLIAIALALIGSTIGAVIVIAVGLITAVFIFLDQFEGGLYVVGAFFKNIGLWIANLVLAFDQAKQNVYTLATNLIAGLIFAFKAGVDNIGTLFTRLWLKLNLGALGFQETVLSVVKTVADKANQILGIFGLDIDISGIEKKLQDIRDKKTEAETALTEAEYKSLSEAFDKGMNTFEYGSIGEAFNTFEVFKEGWDVEAYDAGAEVGANFRDGILESLKEKMDGAGSTIEFGSSGKSHGGAGKDLSDIFGEDFKTELDTSKLGINMSSLNETVNTDLLTNQIGQTEQLKNLDTNILQTNTDMNASISTLQNTLGAKLDDVRRACEDIEINVTKVYGGEGYASGGFPTTGQMFYARENGIPELVGRIGSRTAVANNDQITQGIATAVYNAMVSANQGGDNSFNIYLDGRQINASVEKVKKEKGASIMTGGLRFG